jgi:putative ABC transport system ATP-binding protein
VSNRKNRRKRQPRPDTGRPRGRKSPGASPPGAVTEVKTTPRLDGQSVPTPLLRPAAAPPRIDRPVLEIEGLEQRLYDPQRGEEFVVHASDRIIIPAGGVVAILGPSGCGKTTLLTVLGLLRRPSYPAALKRFAMWVDDGHGKVQEHDLKQTWFEGKIAHVERLRRSAIGFALQSGELLPALNVRENIAAPLQLNGITGWDCWSRVDDLLEAFGLHRGGGPAANGSKLSYSRVNKLSGGEYQRVALARAIAHRPTLVFVDEPTAALNRELARGALEQLRTMQLRAKSHGATVMITHDEQLADEFATMIIRMAPMRGRPAGEVVEVIRRDRAESVPVLEYRARPAVNNGEVVP